LRRSLASTVALALALAAAGGSRGVPDSGLESALPDDSDPDLPDGVLIYTGHGGVSSAGLDGGMTHQQSTALLEDAGLTVSRSGSWPESFDAYRLVILPGPGANDSGAEFTTLQRAALQGLMSRGGVVLVESEHGGAMNVDLLNDLVWDLGGGMYVGEGTLEGTGDNIADTALTAGVDSVGFDVAGPLDSLEQTCLVASEWDCVLGASPHGLGWLVLASDGHLFEDLAGWTDEGHDNDILLLDLARL